MFGLRLSNIIKCRPRTKLRFLVTSDPLTFLSVHINSLNTQETDIEIRTRSKDYSVGYGHMIDESFKNVRNVSSILKIATAKPKIDYAFKALQILAELSKTKSISFKDVEDNKNYLKFVSVVQTQGNHRSVWEIVNALKNLIALGAPDDCFLVESLENDLLWNVKKVSVHSLLLILLFQSENLRTDRQKQVFAHTLSALETRWSEMKYANEFCLAYSSSHLLNNKILANVDDLVVEYSEKMSLVEMYRVVIAVAASNRRPTTVIRSLGYKMFKSSDQLTPKKISNLAFAFNKLNFPNEPLLTKLAADFVAQIDKVTSPSAVGGLLLCMGQMRWGDKVLIDALSEWVMKNIALCRVSDITSLLLTMASVSYSPNNIDELTTVCLQQLKLELISEKSIIVDIVWSLVVLGQADESHVSLVLNPSFVFDISSEDQSHRGTMLKLLNINAAAKTLMDSYSGPTLESSWDTLLTPRSRQHILFQNQVCTALKNFLPPPKYINENHQTDMGFSVDAEFVIDKNCKPLPVSDYTTNFGKIESLKPLPNEAQRIAVTICAFKDFTIDSNRPTGQKCLATRLLNKRGYKVLQVPYYDLNLTDKTLKRVQYFEKKIKEIIQAG